MFPSGNNGMTTNGMTLINTTNDGSEFYNSISNSTVINNNSSDNFGVWVSKYIKINLQES
jgi:hypothetical protein